MNLFSVVQSTLHERHIRLLDCSMEILHGFRHDVHCDNCDQSAAE